MSIVVHNRDKVHIVLFLISAKHSLEVDCCEKMGDFFQEM